MEFKPLSKLSAPALTYPPDDAPQFQTWRDPKPMESPPDPADSWRPTSIAWLMLWLLLGGFCFLQSKPTSWATPTIAKDSADLQPTIKQFESKPIQDIRTGMRVVANNPELQGQDVPQTDIHPETYRNIRLRMAKPGGDELQITLLRSLDWLKAHHPNANQEIPLSFPELGIDGPAKVLAIAPCPTLETGPGRVVTGTFRHSAANVIDLYVSCEDQPIGTTANHPFWSETRQDFVQAGTLLPGEELRTATGKPAVVTSIVPRAGPQPVFNLEVDAEHSYHVTQFGVLVHNGNATNYHLNFNDAVGDFGVYEIRVNGALYKVGKADLGRITEKTGLPTRLHQQVRKLKKELGEDFDVVGEVVDNIGVVTTAEAKVAESARLQTFYDQSNLIPVGNRKSFIPVISNPTIQP